MLLGGALTITTARADAVKFKQLLEAAKKEAAGGTTFLVYASNPRSDKTRQALFAAFKKKYDLPDFRFEWLSLHPSVAAPRVVAETRGGKSGPDVLMSSASTLLEVNREGLLDAFNWMDVFGSEFADIKEASDERVPMELKGKWVVIYDATRSFDYNTTQVKPNEVPNNIEDVADPKWSRKFAMNASGASPFDLLMLVWGEDKTFNIVKRIIANRPIFKNGTPAVVNAVASGEAPIGFGSIHEAERLKVSKKAPIEWKSYGEYIPVLSQGYSLTKKSPHPNLARLFIAWLSMEGMDIYEKMEFSTRVTRKGSALNNIVRERVPNAKIVEPKNQKEFEAFESFATRVEKLIAGSTSGAR
jgi:iron(III) transport system substrate-binding protein